MSDADLTWRSIDTPRGPGRLAEFAAVEEASAGLGVLLSHGAGAGPETADLLALAAALPRVGVSVALFEQPWRTAGRKVATPPPTLDEGLLAAADAWAHPGPLVLGGRSAGARSAARCSGRVNAAGCLLLSFPLHPPGRPERSRLEELVAVSCPVLLVQGERDPMGRPEEFPDGTPTHVVPGGDHSLRVPKRAQVSQTEALETAVARVIDWLTGTVLHGLSGHQ